VPVEREAATVAPLTPAATGDLAADIVLFDQGG
jgi:hypothetical protein